VTCPCSPSGMPHASTTHKQKASPGKCVRRSLQRQPAAVDQHQATRQSHEGTRGSLHEQRSLLCASCCKRLRNTAVSLTPRGRQRRARHARLSWATMGERSGLGDNASESRARSAQEASYSAAWSSSHARSSALDASCAAAKSESAGLEPPVHCFRGPDGRPRLQAQNKAIARLVSRFQACNNGDLSYNP